MSGFARHRRSGHVIATFTGFEADLLRSLASQLVELLRNEAAVPRTHRRLVRGDARLQRPDHRAGGPGAGPAVPHGVPARRGGRVRVPPVHRGRRCATARRPAPRVIIDTLEEAGLPPELTEDGLMIDVEMDRADRRDLAAVVHRPAARAGHPARGRGGRRRRLARDARRRPARAGPRHLPVGRLPPGDPGRRADRRWPAGLMAPIPEFVRDLRSPRRPRPPRGCPASRRCVRRGDEELAGPAVRQRGVGADRRDRRAAARRPRRCAGREVREVTGVEVVPSTGWRRPRCMRRRPRTPTATWRPTST